MYKAFKFAKRLEVTNFNKDLFNKSRGLKFFSATQAHNPDFANADTHGNNSHGHGHGHHENEADYHKRKFNRVSYNKKLTKTERQP